MEKIPASIGAELVGVFEEKETNIKAKKWGLSKTSKLQRGVTKPGALKKSYIYIYIYKKPSRGERQLDEEPENWKVY